MNSSRQKGMPQRGRTSVCVDGPELENGDRLTQAEFHRRYLAHPGDDKFELVGGTVYLASPLRWLHGAYHLKLGTVFDTYASHTPGVEAADNATMILGEESEPQPDLCLRILESHGGRSRLTPKGYVVGSPELLAEIAHSTAALDMHQKRLDYQRASVQEYLVLCVEEQQLHWFNFKSRRLITPDRHGVYRSRAFPGLWIDGSALMARDSKGLLGVLQQGLDSREHERFREALQAGRRRQS
jgi:hypothetical protein